MHEWIVCLEECLPDFGINLERENIEKLAKVMKENASCISDMGYEMRGGSSTKQEPDYKSMCERLRNELASVKHENDIFRSSVANRRKVDMSSVRIENDTVMVYP
jgi:hypothetical protein